MSIFRKKQSKSARGSYTGELLLDQINNFQAREAYNSIRTNLSFAMSEDGCRKILITGSERGAHKSTSAVNTALSLTEAGHQVLLIDCDLRLPTVAEKLGVTEKPGLSNLLAGQCNAKSAIRKLENGLSVMPAGDTPPNPSELLGSRNMKELMSILSQYYHYIILDTPPAGVVTDACVLSGLVDGVAIVVKQDQSTLDELEDTVKQLEMVNANILGFIMTNVRGASKRKGGSYKSYGYGYGDPYIRQSKTDKET